MPEYNPEVTNGIDSVSLGLVHVKGSTAHAFVRWAIREGWYFDKSLRVPPHPCRHRHGAMLRVSKEGIYRCGELGCDVGCFVIEA